MGITRSFIAPVLSWDISDRTNVTFNFEYSDSENPSDFGLVAIGERVADIPFDRNLGEPGDNTTSESIRAGYQLEHRFSDNWQLRNSFYFTRFDSLVIVANRFRLDEATGTLFRTFLSLDQPSDQFELQTNVVGEFSTGSIDHTLLAGVDLSRSEGSFLGFGNFRALAPFDIFNPVYGELARPDFDQVPSFFDSDFQTDRIGVYIQDQIALSDNLILLAGLRYDASDQENTNNLTDTETTQNDDAFSPRVGLVYQPTEEVSLFGSYSRSFVPNGAFTFAGDLLEPEQGEQFEVGVKTELLDGRLSASLAYFDITKQNVATTDPDNPFFSIATGEERSRGVELDVIGELLPGWNLVANYAYTDARITQDNSGLEGNRRFSVPEHNFNLWTNYEIQTGSLQGLGLGLGVNFVGDRFGDNANSFELDSYFLTNAAISYRRDNWQAGLNIRNLFDVDYIESAEGSRITEINPGEGFTIIGSFSIEF
ncbi:MAG: TonB-dependent siderophore receptor [Leptolyngbya sp. SIO4C5]|nr:TonB-dependent siderophore receptor [Leptolyngbya sp. SIO4C5]